MLVAGSVLINEIFESALKLGFLRNWLVTLFICKIRCSQHLWISFQMAEKMYLSVQRGVGGMLKPESCSLLMTFFACNVLHAVSSVKGKG